MAVWEQCITIYRRNVGYRAEREENYNPNRFQFVDNSRGQIVKIDYIKQDAALDGWTQFIPETSSEFTRAGIVRLDDSVRNYVHCVLGSQAQTRSSILTSLETQKYFVNLLADKH